MSGQEDIIRSAFETVRIRSIRLDRGAVFDWTVPGLDGFPMRSNVPSACDATGAVLILIGKEKKCAVEGLYRGWLKDVCCAVDVDPFWWFRFWRGWDGGIPMQISSDKKKKDGITVTRYKRDEVSSLGVRLAKEFVC